MHVSDVMTRGAEITDPSTMIGEVAKRMRDENIGALPVGENDRLVGMITDRDIALRAVAENRSPGSTAVRDVMSSQLYYCFEDDDIEDAAQTMADHQVRRLPVLSREKRLVGFVALADLCSGSDGAAHTALKGVSSPAGRAKH